MVSAGPRWKVITHPIPKPHPLEAGRVTFKVIFSRSKNGANLPHLSWQKQMTLQFPHCHVKTEQEASWPRECCFSNLPSEEAGGSNAILLLGQYGWY